LREDPPIIIGKYKSLFASQPILSEHPNSDSPTDYNQFGVNMGFLDRLLGKESSKSDGLSLFDAPNTEATLTRDVPLSAVNTVVSSPQTQPPPDGRGSGYHRQRSLRDFRGSVYNSAERGHITALFILDNRFEELDISRDDAIDYLYLYLNGFLSDEDVEEDNVRFFHQLQQLFMARKPLSEFYEIQGLPPFSTKVQRDFGQLLTVSKTDDRALFAETFNSIIGENLENEPIIAIAENSGLSPDEAIIIQVVGPNSGIRKLPRARMGVQAEYCYLCFYYGEREIDWKFRGQMSLLPIGTREFDRLTIEIGGEERQVYFDITDFKGNYDFER